MFENLVRQEAGVTLAADIRHGRLPRSVLFSGAEAAGKLTAALETARILSCTGTPHGSWKCECPSCLKHKSLVSQNLLLLGPRDCFVEIAAAKETFLSACRDGAPYLPAARYLFLRSIRKLTLRFSGILWQGESSLSKIGAVMEGLNEDCERLDFPQELPLFDETSRLCDSIAEQALRLENDFLYDSVPINQIRNMEEWAHTRSEDGKKTVIIENADRMLPGVRNALLKILEEPPEDCVFILLTSKRNAIMQTILSRVRTYQFQNRPLSCQKEVIERVFHNSQFSASIYDYLLTFLPVPPQALKAQARQFLSAVANRSVPDVAALVKACGKFSPRLLFRLFLGSLAELQEGLLRSQAGTEFSAASTELLRACQDNVFLYNQTPAAALESLLRDLSALNLSYGNQLKCAGM